MRVRMTLVGTSALLMHNARLSDPTDEFAMAIAELTSKSDKTIQDQQEIARLEFCGGLYIGANGPMVPAANLKKTLVNAAKARREGKKVERALMPVTAEITLQYKGPRTPDALWADDRYRARMAVRVGKARIWRMRPRFIDWSLESEWELLEDLMNLKALVRIGTEAGMTEGLCDGRTQGFGRFICEVQVPGSAKEAA